MKRKRNRNTRRAIQAIVLGSTAATNAAIIVTDGTGHVTVDSAASGANSIQATVPAVPAPPFTVNVLAGAALTGDAGADVVQILSAGYNVNNAGSLTGATNAINSTGLAVNVTNSGAITGTAGQGIVLDSGTIINNAGGTIGGGDDAIRGNNGLVVTNNGTITGFTGAGSDGIQAVDSLTVTNNGTLVGNVNGINAGANLVLTNGSSSFINGNSGIGVLATDNAIINNAGTIQSTIGTDAISVGNTANITNTGSIDGVTSGIVALDNLTLTNGVSGSINGDTSGGVIAGANANITNAGSITGLEGGIAINGAVSTITNSGSITGTGGDGIFGGAGVDTINNTGTITGAVLAINGGAGADIFNLNDGSVINGGIDGGADVDTINFDGGLLSVFDSTTNVVHGNVLVENVNKSSVGTAFLGGVGEAFTNSIDTINITGGGLYINGTLGGLTGATTTITHNGTGLGGTGTWTADITLGSGAGFSAGGTPINLTNNPALDAIGTLNVVGNVTHTAGSFIRYDVQPQSFTPVSGPPNGDLIVHSGGTYDLGPSSVVRISPTEVNQALSDGVYTVIDSNAPISGSQPTLAVQFNGNIGDFGPAFGSETSDVGVGNTNTVLTQFFIPDGVQLSPDGTDMFFEIIHDYEGLPGLTDNQRNLGAAIDASINNPDSDIQDFIAALDYSDLETVQDSLAAISPEAYFGLTTAVINSNYRLHRMVQEHLAAVRNGREVAAPVMTDSKGGKGGMVSSPAPMCGRGNVWGALSYDWQDYDGSPDFDGETGAITAGADWCVAPGWVLGGVLDASTSDFDGNNGGGSDVDSFRVAFYGTWGESVGLYSDFLVGYGNHDLDLDGTRAGVLSTRNTGSTDGDSIQALWTIGYAMGDANFKHGPFAGLEYQNVDVDDFNTRGALPIDVDGYDVDSLRGLIGYRVNAASGNWRPYASVAYAHEFEDDEIHTRAFFGDEPFRVSGAELGSAVLVTAGTGVILNDSLTLDVGYRGEICVDDDGITSHGATVGLNWCF